MPESVITVFLSATSSDLAPCREAAARVLRRAGVFPKIQEEFPADSRTLTAHLRALIAQCDAVICLVGETFGSAPRPGESPARSYTQLEYDIASELGKPAFVYLSRNGCFPGASSDSPEEQLSQERYRSDLQQLQKCEWFRSLSDLETQIALLVPRLRQAEYGKVFYRHVEEAPSHFVGRWIETEQLRRALWQDSPAVVAVVGMGGQGKTTLVAEFLRSEAGLPFANAFYCSGYRGAFSFDDFLDCALDFFHLGLIDKRTHKSTEARVSLLMEALQRRRLLIVIDGIERWLRAWNEDSAETSGTGMGADRRGYFDGLDDFLRQCTGLANGSHVLITTRAIPSALDGRRLTVVPVYGPNADQALRGLDPEDSEKLLREFGVRGEPDQIRAVAASYGHHPLALTILGALLADAHGGNIAKWESMRARGMDPRRAFDELLTITRANLPGRSGADRLLQVASQALEDPPLEAIAAALGGGPPGTAGPEEELRQQAIILSKWQLMTWNGDQSTISLHPLIKQYFGAFVTPEESQVINRRMAEWYDSQPIPHRPSTLEHARCRVLAISHHVRSGDGTRARNLFFSPMGEGKPFADWLTDWGHQEKAVELLNHLIGSFGGERASLLSSRGAFRRQLLQLQAAAADLDEAILVLSADSDQSSPERLLDLAGACMNRGNVGRDSGAWQDSRYYDQALDALARIRDLRYLFAKATETARVRINRANFLYDLGEFSGGLADCEAAVSLCRDLIADGDASQRAMLAAALESQAILLADMRRRKEAISYFSEALQLIQELREEGLEEMTPRMAQLRSMIGVVLGETGQTVEALESLDSSIATFQPMIESGRADIRWQLALAYMNRSLVLVRRGEWDAACRDGERSVAMFANMARQEPRMAGWQGHALTILAEARFEKGDQEGAQAARERGLGLLKEFLGKGKGGHAVFLRRSAFTARYLISTQRDAALRVLEEAVQATERGLAWNLGAEGLRLEAAGVLEMLSQAPELRGVEISGPLLTRLGHCIRQ